MNAAVRRMASFVMLILIFAACARAAGATVALPMKLEPLAGHVAGKACYRVHVESAGVPILILLLAMSGWRVCSWTGTWNASGAA